MALILNMPMQDNASGPPGLVIDDVSASNNDANFGVVNTEDINVAGPGGAYPRALNFGGATLVPDGAQFQTTIEINTSNRTVGFFAKLSIGENNPIFGSDPDGEWLTVGADHVELQNLVGGSNKAHGINTTNWHHYALTNSGGDWMLFVDGVSLGAFSAPMTGQLRAKKLAFNSDMGLAPGLTMAGLKIYDEVRTGAQILADYALGLNMRHTKASIGISVGF